MFDGDENDNPGNAELSLYGAADITDDSRAGFADRAVLISHEMLCRDEWGVKPRVASNAEDSPCVIDTGVYGGGGPLCSYYWVCKYLRYLKAISPPAKLKKTLEIMRNLLAEIRNLETLRTL